MLTKLAEKHNKWLSIAYNLCKCKEASNDIVQDMYLKMYEINKEVDDGYIYFVLRSIFIESKRKQKEFTSDNEKVFMNIIENETENKELILNLLKKSTNDLDAHEKIIIHFSNNLGLREFCRQSGISINLVIKVKRKLKIILWQKTTKYEELAILSAKLQKQLDLKNVKDVLKEKTFLI